MCTTSDPWLLLVVVWIPFSPPNTTSPHSPLAIIIIAIPLSSYCDRIPCHTLKTESKLSSWSMASPLYCFHPVLLFGHFLGIGSLITIYPFTFTSASYYAYEEAFSGFFVLRRSRLPAWLCLLHPSSPQFRSFPWHHSSLPHFYASPFTPSEPILVIHEFWVIPRNACETFAHFTLSFFYVLHIR